MPGREVTKRVIADEVLSIIGDPRKAALEATAFARDARDLSGAYERLAERYGGQWIVFKDGDVQVAGSSLEAALRRADRLGIRRGGAIVRYVHRDEPVIIV